jgi:2-keto-4-pentenoate hydratase
MTAKLEENARRIVNARKSMSVLEDLAWESEPPAIEEGYRLQRAATQLWGDEVAGWKVGATAKRMQEFWRVSEPLYGPIFRNTVFRSPASVPARDFRQPMLESEFAFRFGADLPPRARPYAREEIVAAVDALVPAFEIISSRVAKLSPDNVPLVVADFCANGGAVCGRPIENWRSIDLPAQKVALHLGGALREQGSGADVLGNPLNVLDWLVNALRAQGIALVRGQIVLTGTMTGLHAAEAGQPAVADFGALGKVQVSFV